MANYPETIVPTVPYDTSDEYLTIESGEYDSGSKVVSLGRVYPLYRARLRYNTNYWSLYTALYQFFRDCRGKYGTFTFTDFNGWDSVPIGIQWPKLYVGVLDGATLIYDLPYKSGSSYEIYRNGSLLTVTTDYAIGAGTGTDGRDKITLVAAGTAGHILEAKAIGRRVVNARFNIDTISMSSFYNMLTETGLEIVEAR